MGVNHGRRYEITETSRQRSAGTFHPLQADFLITKTAASCPAHQYLENYDVSLIGLEVRVVGWLQCSSTIGHVYVQSPSSSRLDRCCFGSRDGGGFRGARRDSRR